MTSAEATILRTALYTQYLAWINAGCPTNYMINGRSKTVDASFFMDQLTRLDNIIARASSGSFAAVQFRRPE